MKYHTHGEKTKVDMMLKIIKLLYTIMEDIKKIIRTEIKIGIKVQIRIIQLYDIQMQ